MQALLEEYMKQADGYLLETIAGVPYLLPYGQNIADLKRGVQLNDTGVFLWQTLAQEISSDELLHKFFTFLMAPRRISLLLKKTWKLSFLHSALLE